ncbi:MAG TPA: aspartate kinase [Gemmatimonadales bacterium]|nr:aspartate kinase [Gemmatimonadales bacterium]
MIVCKFGGTSVGDAAAIGRLVEIVRARHVRGEQPLVVVSALSGVTDALVALTRLTAAPEPARAVDDALAALLARHEAVAAELPGGAGAMRAVRERIDALRALLAPSLGTTVPPADRDAALGHGELWSSALVAAALEASGVPAGWVDVRPLLVTDDHFGQARPDQTELRTRARARFPALLEAGLVPVTQGFIGATPDGRPTILGRGGSDFSAALLGAALDAERVEIWTDVSGLLTADPRIVPDARPLEVVSYEEAAELATFGAKVLHPATALPLAHRGIPIAILNSTCPGHPGSTIAQVSALREAGASPVRSINWKRGVTIVNVRAPRMLGAHGFLRRLFEVTEKHEIVVDVLASSEVSVSLSVEGTSRVDVLKRDLAPLGEVQVAYDRAIISVVGIGLRETPGIAARIFAAVAPTNVEMTSQGASAINMTFVVRESEGADVVRRLHRAFFGGGGAA